MAELPLQMEVSRPIPDTAIRWKYIVPTLFVIWVIGVVDKIGVAVIVTNRSFLEDMHLVGNHALIGSLVTALLFSYGVGFFFWGWLTDLWGPRRCAAVGLIGWAASTALAAVASNFAILFISRIFLGLTEAFLWPVSNSFTARWFPLRERGRAKSVWVNGVSVGSAVAGFFVTFLLPLAGWRGVFWVLTAVALLICLPMVWFLTSDRPEKDRRVSPTERDHISSDQLSEERGPVPQRGLMKSLNYWMVVLAFTGTILGVYGLGSWFPSYLAIAKHFSPVVTSTYMLLAWGTAIVITIWVGIQTDRKGKKALWNACGFAGAVIFLLLASTVPSPSADALLAGAAIALIQGITTPMGHGLMHSMSATQHIGIHTGVMTGVSNMVGAFGPTIMGALITLAHGQYALAFGFLEASFVAAALASAVLVKRGY